MNKKELIRMAQEAGWDDHHCQFDTRIERFAALVEAHVLAGQREKYTWGTPLLDAFLLAPKPGQLKDRGTK